ncbi:MAG: 3-beta hydroxysteroid dehydrogenase [Candidatus Sericytochromatia bacterium]|nr:MAG: 3-beta hydroxysteroid dehydrogenase [Candidatus Sericytochromatia bacterium]
MGLNILVTGASGFLGSIVVEELSKNKDYNLISTGRNKNNLEKLSNLSVIKQGFLENTNFTNEITKNIDIIIHSAALSSPWGKYQDFYNSNILATQNLLKSAVKNNVRRFINISTPSIYFDYKDRFNIKEDFLPKKFVNYYAETKYKAEMIVKEFFQKGLIEALSLRPRAIVGKGDTTIMPRLIKAQKSGKLRVIGDGKNILDITSVKNVVYAIDLSIKASSNALGEAYNITNDKPILIWEFIDKAFNKLGLKLNKNSVSFDIMYNIAKVLEELSKFTNREPVLTCYGVGALSKSMTLNIDKAKSLLKYKPIQSNEDALNEFVNWYKENNYL